jgi:hypothetical protein
VVGSSCIGVEPTRSRGRVHSPGESDPTSRGVGVRIHKQGSTQQVGPVPPARWGLVHPSEIGCTRPEGLINTPGVQVPNAQGFGSTRQVGSVPPARWGLVHPAGDRVHQPWRSDPPARGSVPPDKWGRVFPPRASVARPSRGRSKRTWRSLHPLPDTIFNRLLYLCAWTVPQFSDKQCFSSSSYHSSL